MKFFRFAFFAMALAVAAPTENVRAVVSSQSAATEISVSTAPELSKKQLRRLDRLEKLLAKQDARAAKKAAAIDEKVDFQDPIEKWMWFWLLGWAAGLVFSILGAGVIYGLWYLGYLCWTAGTICLIIWLLKKTGTID